MKRIEITPKKRLSMALQLIRDKYELNRIIVNPNSQKEGERPEIRASLETYHIQSLSTLVAGLNLSVIITEYNREKSLMTVLIW